MRVNVTVYPLINNMTYCNKIQKVQLSNLLYLKNARILKLGTKKCKTDTKLGLKKCKNH